MKDEEAEEFRKLLWSKELDPLFERLKEERSIWEKRNLTHRDLLNAVSILSYVYKQYQRVNEEASKMFAAVRDRQASNLSPEDIEGELNRILSQLPDWILPALKAAMSIGAETQKSDLALTAAKVRHAENNAMRDQAIQYYSEHAHRFSSMEAAAAEIVAKVVPVRHRTAYEWIRQHRKELQSARKP